MANEIRARRDAAVQAHFDRIDHSGGTFVISCSACGGTFGTGHTSTCPRAEPAGVR